MFQLSFPSPFLINAISGCLVYEHVLGAQSNTYSNKIAVMFSSMSKYDLTAELWYKGILASIFFSKRPEVLRSNLAKFLYLEPALVRSSRKGVTGADRWLGSVYELSGIRQESVML
ncbi:hypothetical protein AVEN_185279-1 [Araneus ventricosus]|uniref:Uncharacterized protein n=1 Tax=Araneus ventricosus TaxID=182803 RepID=A0A4Y2T271_ARAVE|nr:hypothetical protein AVEN_185279-1 [Araneus ventricosus]